MNPQGSTRLVKFLLKKGTGVSWSDLQSFATTSTPVEETAVLEVLRACVVEDQKSEETLREDYKEKKADALHATLFFAENRKYWRLLKVTARQEGIELNRDTRHAKEETALVSIIRSHSRYLPSLSLSLLSSLFFLFLSLFLFLFLSPSYKSQSLVFANKTIKGINVIDGSTIEANLRFTIKQSIV